MDCEPDASIVVLLVMDVVIALLVLGCRAPGGRLAPQQGWNV